MVISERRELAAYHKTVNGVPEFKRWGASQQLTLATAPRVRGTRSFGGGLLLVRYAYAGR
jgi:hypothetical protein